MANDLASFDIPKELVAATEPLVALVGVHLHLEAFIIELITRRLPNPSALEIDRLNFPSKLGLAVALGTVPEVATPALKAINALRNRIAHNLRAELTSEDAEKLKGELSFVRSSSSFASWATLPPPQQVVLCAMVLQAWLNGVVHVLEQPGMLGVAELKAAAHRRYPDPT